MSKVRTEANGSKNNEWETPEYIYDVLNKEFEFNWDLACTSSNCKTDEGCMNDKGINGLDWIPKPNKEYRIWCNPPYSIQLKPKFIERCYTLSQLENVKEVVMLIPSTTETKQFHEIMIPNCEIRFIHKRVRFKGINTKGKYVTNKTGQSGSMVIIFNRKPKMCILNTECIEDAKDGSK